MNSQMQRHKGHSLGGSQAQEGIPVELGFIPLLVPGYVYLPGSFLKPLL